MPTEGETGNNILVTPVPNISLSQFVTFKDETLRINEEFKKMNLKVIFGQELKSKLLAGNGFIN